MSDSGIFRASEQTEPIDWRRMRDFLAARGIEGELAPPRQFAAGFGNWNFLLEIGGVRYVLRRPPDGPLPAGANDMSREYRVLSKLHSHFPLAPAVHVHCDDPNVIGAPFLLIEHREGVVVRSDIPPVLAARFDPRDFTSRAVDVLVALHGLDPATVGLQDLGRHQGMVERQARNWRLRSEAAFDGTLPGALREVSEWLTRLPPQPQRVSILHSDFKFDNLIVSPQTAAPVALIDWDMGTLGDPLLDVATFLSYWAEMDDPAAMRSLRQMPTASSGFPRRAEVLALYAERSGLDVSAFGYYRVLALFKLCVVFQQLHQRHQRGLTQDARVASFGSLAQGLADFTADVLANEHL